MDSHPRAATFIVLAIRVQIGCITQSPMLALTIVCNAIHAAGSWAAARRSNGMIYMRGQARDYDGWAKLTGDDSWVLAKHSRGVQSP